MSESPRLERRLQPAESSAEYTVELRDTAARAKSPDIPQRMSEIPTPAAEPSARIRSAVSSDPDIQKIESVLEEGMGEYFLRLSPIQQKTFKEHGENAAQDILRQIRRGKNLTKRIVQIIARWLRSLPGVNRFFLEQESKIKTDTIVKLFRDG